MNINDLGFSGYFKSLFYEFEEQGFLPARVINEQKELYTVMMENGEIHARVSGKFLHQAVVRSDFPAVGDWVAVTVEDDFAVIHAVIERKSSFSRNVAGSNKRKSGGITEEQIVAANIDTVFIVTGLDKNYNLRRIERYLTLAWNSGASPVVILNKSDLCENIEEIISEVEIVSPGVPVHAVSARENHIETLKPYLIAGKTVALLGSSGVGKSTIVNVLLGKKIQSVNEISDSVHKGRHTTTTRQLFLLDNGAMLIDTPGMREIQFWGEEESISAVFEDIEDIMSKCRFSDCTHNGEPGCAIAKALETGELDQGRYQNYLSLQAELALLEQRKTKSKQQMKKEWEKEIAKKVKEFNKSEKGKFGR